MATFVKHTSCPVCGSSDALAHYSDGSSYCFSHSKPLGHSTRPGFIEDEEEDEAIPPPPDDLCHDFSQEVLDWIKPTQLTIEELIQNDCYYSPKARRFYRLLENGCYESRRLGPVDGRGKAIFRGDKSLVTGYVGGKCPRRHPAGSQPLFRLGGYAASEGSYTQEAEACANQGLQQGRQPCSCLGGHLTIVEDTLSAIKCGRVATAVALFGSSIQNDKLARLVIPFKSISVWLDGNKYSSAHSIGNRASLLGKRVQVICTDADPKYCNVEEFIQTA